ncbi:hypothetical protein BDY24DRAFT_335348 [Mrakia frigida]|uniref:uncharacterized protein n=1 Tax=Mrakia frigida TaxID=29902 RepID=UPI003FCC1413
MVSFQCDSCSDVVKKPKLDQHYNRCWSPFTCLDCSKTFMNGGEWKSHTSCISEAEKYEKTLYKGPKKVSFVFNVCPRNGRAGGRRKEIVELRASFGLSEFLSFAPSS